MAKDTVVNGQKQTPVNSGQRRTPVNNGQIHCGTSVAKNRHLRTAAQRQTPVVSGPKQTPVDSGQDRHLWTVAKDTCEQRLLGATRLATRTKDLLDL